MHFSIGGILRYNTVFEPGIGPVSDTSINICASQVVPIIHTTTAVPSGEPAGPQPAQKNVYNTAPFICGLGLVNSD